MTKLNKRTLLKNFLIIIALCSTSVMLVACIGITYPNTSELPSACKKFSLSSSLSADCKEQILTLRKAETAQEPLCYDNDRYVPCSELAHNLLKGKQLLFASSLTAAVTVGIITLLMKKRRDK